MGKYGEKKLQAMVEALDLSPEETDKKSLVECLKQYLKQCPCSKGTQKKKNHEEYFRGFFLIEYTDSLFTQK